MKRNLLLISNSTLHGSGYLDHCEDEIKKFLEGKKEVLFIPYARPSGITHDEYTKIAKDRFEKMGFKLTGIHKHKMPKEAVKSAMIPFQVESDKLDAQKWILARKQEIAELKITVKEAQAAKELDFDKILDAIDKLEIAERRLNQGEQLQISLFEPTEEEI